MFSLLVLLQNMKINVKNKMNRGKNNHLLKKNLHEVFNMLSKDISNIFLIHVCDKPLSIYTHVISIVNDESEYIFIPCSVR